MISKDEAIAKFKEILGTKAAWVQIGKSQFIEHFAIFQGWALRSALWAVERVLQEFFLSTALNKSSILAHVEDREYLPRKPTPSSGTVRISNNGGDSIALPVYQQFLSDLQISYICTDAVVIASGQSVDIEFEQVEIQEIEHTVTAEEPFYEVLFEKDLTARISSFTVFVDMEDGFEEWGYARLLKNTNPDSKVYDEFYSHNDQIGIRFGNGDFGLIPPTGSVVKVELRLTSGETFLAQNQKLSVVDEVLDYARQPADITATTLEAITGGQPQETGEELRKNLNYWHLYNEDLIWQSDYIYFIKKKNPNIIWAKVWGEEEAEAAYGPSYDFINKIFITAYAEDQPEIGDDILSDLSAIPLLNREFEWVEPVFSTFSLAITGQVHRRLSVDTVIQSIKDAFEKNYGKDSVDRLDKVFVKDFYKLITETGHFTDDGANFEISYSGTVEATALNEMVSIDMDSTTISIGYL
jgi:hypothetical protein